MSRKAVTFLDIVIIAVVFVAATAIFHISFLKGSGNRLVVKVEEKIVFEGSLFEDFEKEINTDLGSNTVVIKNGECFVSHADCKDGICKSKGKISKKGETIICLPHRLIVEVE